MSSPPRSEVGDDLDLHAGRAREGGDLDGGAGREIAGEILAVDFVHSGELALIVEDKNIREAFRPIGIANRLDQTSAKILEGMRITFHLIKEMDKACKQEGCRLLVVIIPTKETVFSEYLENNARLHLHETIDRLITNERSARNALIEFLAGAGIAHMDTLPALKQSVGDQLYAQTTRDMHPGKNGYRVIGEVVAEYLNRSDHDS